MIRPLRQRHRVIMCALSVILPVAFVGGIAARKAVPVMASLPSAVVGERPRLESVVWERADLWTMHPIRTRLLTDRDGSRAVELTASQAILRPDLIVCWTPTAQALTDILPEDAILLGAFAAHGTFVLPVGAGGRGGALVLYSLADHEVVAVSKPFTF